MSRVLQKIFFNNEPLVAYRVIGSQEKICERVILHSDTIKIDVSQIHCIVCQTPFVVAVWLPPDKVVGNIPSLKFLTQKTTTCTIRLHLVYTLSFGSNTLYLFRVTKSSSSQLSFFKRHLLFFYFHQTNKNKILWKDGIDFSVLYSYPRRVILTSFRNADHFNVFPMDFQGYIESDRIFLLGLRKTNVTLSQIIKDRRVVVGDVSVDNTDNVYFLGKHHSKQLLNIREAPFRFYESAVFNFYLPDFVTAYKEIEITDHKDLGSHIMLIGKVIHEKHSESEENLFHHLHILQYLNRLETSALKKA